LSFVHSDRTSGRGKFRWVDFTIDAEACSTNTFVDCLSDASIPADD